MNKKLLIIIFLFLSNLVHANVALSELNSLLAQKEKKIVTKPIDSSTRDLQENYYFIFIYRSNCPHCHKFAPILKDFAKSFKVKIQSYTLDGKSLPEFEGRSLTPQLFQILYAQGQYKPVVPALFLVNRHTLEAYAVLFGEATPYQLASRVQELLKHIEEKFHV